VEIARNKVAGVLNLEGVSTSSAPTLEGYDTVGHGVYGCTFRRCIVNTEVRSIYTVYGV
jgi:hypothetical protein